MNVADLQALFPNVPSEEYTQRQYALLRTYLDGLRADDPDFYLDPLDLEPEKVQRACELFARYGSEIGAGLLLAALPESYAAGTGSRVLYGVVSALAAQDGDQLTRRIAATAQFLMDVMVPAPVVPLPQISMSRAAHPDVVVSVPLQVTRGLWGLQPCGDSGLSVPARALFQVVMLRLRHSYIRLRNRRDVESILPPGAKHEVLLNQEDLLGTLLTFSVTTFEVLEQLGITWSSDDQAAYLHVWDIVGHYLGIGNRYVIGELSSGDESDDRFLTAARSRGSLRPQTVADARALLEKIRARLWSLSGQPDESPFEDFQALLDGLQPGRLLLRGLLSDLQAAMPAGRQVWPINVMRQLAPEPVQNRLALGGTTSTGLFWSGLSACVRRGQSTASRRENPIGARLLRRMATEVVECYFVTLLQKGLTIPNLELNIRAAGVAPGLIGPSDRLKQGVWRNP
jgi:hypothetical protein